MPDDTMQAPVPIDLARVAAEWGQSLDDLEAALEIERAREARDSRPGRHRQRSRATARRPQPRVYGWAEW